MILSDVEIVLLAGSTILVALAAGFMVRNLFMLQGEIARRKGLTPAEREAEDIRRWWEEQW